MERLHNIHVAESGFGQRMVYDVSEETAETAQTGDQVFSIQTHVKDSEIGDPVENVTKKQEKTENESEAIQGADAIKKVKKQISQLLVSKYVKQDEDLLKADEDSASETDTDPIESVKKQISNLLQEKYALSQKSTNTLNDDVLSETAISEKSKHVEEIHVENEKYAMDDKNESQITYNSVEDFDNGLKNVIEGYSLAAEETGQDVKDTQISELGHNTLPTEEEIFSRIRSGTDIELSFTECENDEAFVNEIVSSVETNNIKVVESSVLPSELIGENVTFQEVDGFSFEENNVATECMGEEELLPEHDIKCELKETENQPLNIVSGPATKVTLDLTTISQLSNIWEKSYKSERKQKKTTIQPAPSRQMSMRTCNTDNVNYVTDSSDVVPSVSAISEEASLNDNDKNSTAEVDIQNLQISEALKLKLMKRNLKVGQRPNLKLRLMKRKVGRPPKLHKTKNKQPCNKTSRTELSESFPADNQEKTKTTATDCQNPGINQNAASSTLKRKVGRPKIVKVKNVPPVDKTNMTAQLKNLDLVSSSESLSTNNQEKTLTAAADNQKIPFKEITLKSRKRKVGRPKIIKMKNVPPVDKTNMTEQQKNLDLGSSSEYLSTNNQEKTHTAATDNQKIQFKEITLKSLKRKVGRPKILKIVPPVDKTNMTSQLKKLDLGSASESLSTNIQEKTHRAATDNQKIQFKEKRTLKSQKRKVGRPKSVKQTNIQAVDKATKVDHCKIKDFDLKPCYVKVMNVDCNVSSIQENDLKIDYTLPSDMSNENVNLKSVQSTVSGKTVKLKPGRPKKTVKEALKLKFKSTLFVNKTLAAAKEKITSNGLLNQNDKGSVPNTPTKSTVKRKSGRPKKVIKESWKTIIKDKSQINETMSATKDTTNEMTAQDSLQLNEIGIKQSEENGAADVAADMWEDDWQSDVADEGDSSDDYLPSEDEYVPNKNEVLKNVFCTKKAKKEPVNRSNSDTKSDDNISNNNEEGDLTHKKQFKKEIKVEVKKYKRHKHKGPRIGRPPAVGEYKCKHCSFTTYEKNLVQKHYNKVHRREWKQCQFCDFASRSTNALLEHEGRKHTDSKPFKCDFEGCDYATNVHTDFIRHRTQKHATEKAFKCPKCDFRTKWKRNIRHHDQIVHNDVRAFVCNICNFAFKRAYDLKGHMERHTDDKPLQCDICGFRCKTNWEIRSHKLSHSNVRPYPCTHPGCKQACKTKSDLSKHMIKHESSRTFKCSMCPRMYKNFTQMKKHERGPLHITTREFKCELCGKDFKTKKCLEKHIRIHKGIKPFKCDICQKDHSTKHNMEKHKETHRLDERPFHCPVCPFGAKLPGALLAHIGAMHGDSYAYYCELCKKPFKRYSQLQMHYKRCHSEKDRKKLGNAFEVDLALMKMEMELDLEDTFDSLRTSSKKTAKSMQKRDTLKIKEEPFDEEFDAIEQDNDNDSDLPPDLRSIGKAGIAKGPGLSNRDTKIPRKRGRPKKTKPAVNTEVTETVNSLERVVEIDDASNCVAAQSEVDVDKEGDSYSLVIENTGEENQSNHDKVSKITKEQNPEIDAMDTETVHFDTMDKDKQEVGLSATIDNELSGKTSVGDTSNESNLAVLSDISDKERQEVENNYLESLATKSESNLQKQEGENDNVPNGDTHLNVIDKDKPDTYEPSAEYLVNITDVDAHRPEVEKSNKTNLTMQLNTEDKAKEIVNSSCLTDTNSTDTNIQVPDGDLNSESSPIDNFKVTAESENKNVSNSAFINKFEENSSATLAVYDGFRLPLATKGFHFNYEKRGKKTKSWFMDPSYMDHDANEKHMKYLRRMGMAAKLPRKKRVFKGRRKRKPAVPKNLSEFVKDRKRKMNYYLKRRKVAEGGELTSEELKELKETLVFERQKRKTSFKGHYTEFETLEGEHLSMTEVQERLPVVIDEGEKVLPKKKRKVLNTDKQVTDSKMKRGKTSVKKTKSDSKKKPLKSNSKKKPILLYSERKKAAKDMSIRKPSFVGKRKGDSLEEEQEFESNKHVVQTESKENSFDTINSPQKRKRGRKPKEIQEKKTKKNAKAKYEPVKPKYKYVKRSQQKKMALENTSIEESEVSAAAAPEGPRKKDKKAKNSLENKVVKAKVRPYQPGEAKKAMKNRTKKQTQIKVKITKTPKQTRVDSSNQLSFSSTGMLHEAVANSNLVRVHLPQNTQSTGDEHISFPDSFNPETGPVNVDIRHVIEGGKSLMYCDDVTVMRDLSSSQEIFGLSVDQIKSETFIEPVEPFSVNQVFKTGMVVNPVHPILLTQSSFGHRLIPTPVGMGITQAPASLNILNSGEFPELVANSNEDFNINEVRDGRANVSKATESVLTDGRKGGITGEHMGRLSIQESSTDREVIQLDYSIVKNELEDEQNY